MIESKFGYWTVKERLPNNKYNQARFKCVCECGTERIIMKEALVRGRSKSCGCRMKKYKDESERRVAIIEHAKEWAENNKERRKEICKKYREVNKEKDKESKRKWMENNPEKYVECRKKCRKKRYHNDPVYRLVQSIRGRLNQYSKRRSKRVDEIIGCSPFLASLILEAQCLANPGMSWENHGKWHIDHVRPLCSFDLTDEKQLLAASHISNLQPLWAKDNWKKGGRYEVN